MPCSLSRGWSTPWSVSEISRNRIGSYLNSATRTCARVIHGAYRIIYEIQRSERVEILTVFRASRQFPNPIG